MGTSLRRRSDYKPTKQELAEAKQCAGECFVKFRTRDEQDDCKKKCFIDHVNEGKKWCDTHVCEDTSQKNVVTDSTAAQNHTSSAIHTYSSPHYEWNAIQTMKYNSSDNYYNEDEAHYCLQCNYS